MVKVIDELMYAVITNERAGCVNANEFNPESTIGNIAWLMDSTEIGGMPLCYRNSDTNNAGSSDYDYGLFDEEWQ